MSTIVPELEIPPLGRFELFARLGSIRVMEPETEVLMQRRARDEWVSDEYDSPHSRPWSHSQHASEFPGDPAEACSRYLAYRMMNFMSDGPMPPWVTATGVQGKSGEMDIVDAWHKGGRLLSIPEDPSDPSIHQLGFEEPASWMTASTDAPVLLPGWRAPFICEVKGKEDKILEEMLHGVQLQDGTVVKRGPDKKHVLQLKATIGLAHDYDWGVVTVCSGCWGVLYADIYERLGSPSRMNPAISEERAAQDNLQYCPFCDQQCEHVEFDLEPPVSGEIYYWSRSWPRKTASFYHEYDKAFMEDGLSVLRSTRDDFVADTVPERPGHFQWTSGPCQKCKFRPFCRLDSGLLPRKRKPVTESIVTVLSESNGVAHTRSLRPHYDPDRQREEVISEWTA